MSFQFSKLSSILEKRRENVSSDDVIRASVRSIKISKKQSKCTQNTAYYMKENKANWALHLYGFLYFYMPFLPRLLLFCFLYGISIPLTALLHIYCGLFSFMSLLFFYIFYWFSTSCYSCNTFTSFLHLYCFISVLLRLYTFYCQFFPQAVVVHIFAAFNECSYTSCTLVLHFQLLFYTVYTFPHASLQC